MICEMPSASKAARSKRAWARDIEPRTACERSSTGPTARIHFAPGRGVRGAPSTMLRMVSLPVPGRI